MREMCRRGTPVESPAGHPVTRIIFSFRALQAPAIPPLRGLMGSSSEGAFSRGDPHKYVIAFAVVLASLLQVIDSSIVNVALPDMMGNLGASLDEIAWVSTGYILASVIVIPLTGLARRDVRAQALLRGVDPPVHGVELLLRRGALRSAMLDLLARGAGHRRRRAHDRVAGGAAGDVPARGSGHGDGASSGSA